MRPPRLNDASAELWNGILIFGTVQKAEIFFPLLEYDDLDAEEAAMRSAGPQWVGSAPESPRIGPWARAAFDNDQSSKKMNSRGLKSMSVEELWSLHELVSAALASKIQVETAKLDQRLRQLSVAAVSHNGRNMRHARRPYPPVHAKYRNPAEPSETWAGRGKRPRWLSAQLKSGKQIDDFRIDMATAQAAE